MREERSRKIQRADQVQHYDELESRVDPAATERFKHKPYQTINVIEYVTRKYGIRRDGNVVGKD